MIWFDLDGTLRDVLSLWVKDPQTFTYYEGKCDNGLTMEQNFRRHSDDLLKAPKCSDGGEVLNFAMGTSFLSNLGIITDPPLKLRYNSLKWLNENFDENFVPITPKEFIDECYYINDGTSHNYIPVLFCGRDERLPLLFRHFEDRYKNFLIDDYQYGEGAFSLRTFTPKRAYNRGKELTIETFTNFVTEGRV